MTAPKEAWSKEGRLRALTFLFCQQQATCWVHPYDHTFRQCRVHVVPRSAALEVSSAQVRCRQRYRSALERRERRPWRHPRFSSSHTHRPWRVLQFNSPQSRDWQSAPPSPQTGSTA
eukprot:364215-Chlamydomonas_euryale.AAC.11